MIYRERLFKILRFPYVSEKSSITSRKYNVIVFKVAKYATKSDIKNAVTMLFAVKVYFVNTVVIFDKIAKNSSKKVGYRSNWKKAYVLIEKGKKIDFNRHT